MSIERFKKELADLSFDLSAEHGAKYAVHTIIWDPETEKVAMVSNIPSVKEKVGLLTHVLEDYLERLTDDTHQDSGREERGQLHGDGDGRRGDPGDDQRQQQVEPDPASQEQVQ